MEYLQRAQAFATQHGLGLHLDGARIFNASVKLGIPVADISQQFDSVSVCLSKGLCAPVGSVLGGPKEFIKEAHRWRKMLGGGMRQAGVLASAGILAITEQVPHLAQDHENAALLAERLNEVAELEIDPGTVQTNMVFAEAPTGMLPTLIKRMRDRGVLGHGLGDTLRLVTHHDFEQESIDFVANAIKDAFRDSSP